MQVASWQQAWRSLWRRPAYFLTAVATLALGTAITAAAFSLVDTVLLKPLPYPDADRLVTVFETSPSAREGTSLVAPARMEDWHRLNRTFVAISGSYGENVTDTGGAVPERLEGRRVAPRFFEVFANPPLAGRFFTAEEELPTGPGAAVISEGYWTRRFARDPGAVGHALTIGGERYQIVGIVPASFTSAATDVWLPAKISPGLMQVREARFLSGIGRLRPGVSLEAASQDLAAVQEGLAQQHPRTDAGWSAEIRPLKDARVGNSRKGLLFLFGAVLTLWAIAVANLAGLTLVQMNRRTRELAIRSALGASRTRVIGTVMREGLLIAFIGGALGAALTTWLIGVIPTALTRTPRINELATDPRSLAFIAITTLVAACVFSLFPAYAGTRSDLNRLVSTRVASGRHRLQHLLVVAQVALSVVLVSSATLLLRSYYQLSRVDTGLDAAGVITFHVGARWDEDRTRIGALQATLIERLEGLPHVQAAGLTNFLPATGATLRSQVSIEGISGPNHDGTMTVGSRMISGGYLRAIRAPLLAGSFCRGLDTSPGAPQGAMVNRRFMEMFAPGRNLVGRSLAVIQGASVRFTITGMIGDIAEDGHGSAPAPYVYLCTPAGAWPDPEYAVRTSDPRAFAGDLRRITRELDSTRAVFGLRRLEEVLAAALDQPRLDAAMLTLFAAAALLLAALGLYSLFTLVVADRAREMAVRLAVGATPSHLIALVAGGAGRLVAWGIAAGLGLTIAAERVLRSMAFATSPLDAPALLSAVLVLALRAGGIEPVEVLKVE
jgi:putative ABC transport system permease protein